MTNLIDSEFYAWVTSTKMIKNNPDMQEITVNLRGDKSIISRVLRFLSIVSYLGDIGHSCEVAMAVDGDGADRLKINKDISSQYMSDISDSVLSSDIVVHDDSFEPVKIHCIRPGDKSS